MFVKYITTMGHGIKPLLGIAGWILLFLISPVIMPLIIVITLIFGLSYLTQFWFYIICFIIILYLPFYFDFIFPSNYKKQSRLWEPWTASFFMWGIAKYLNIKVIYLSEEYNSSQYIFSISPHGHGAFACNAFINHFSGIRQKFIKIRDKLRYLTVSAIFWTPVIKEVTMFLGGCDASKSTAEWLCNNGYSLLIIPGGIEEQINTTQGRYDLYIDGKKHSGHIKLALKFGIPIIPVFAFGPPNFFAPVQWIKPFQKFLFDYFRMGIPFIMGRFYSCIPYEKQLTVIVGKPLHFNIDVEKGKDPSEEQIQKAQKIYINSIVSMFNQFKSQYAPDEILEIH